MLIMMGGISSFLKSFFHSSVSQSDQDMDLKRVWGEIKKKNDVHVPPFMIDDGCVHDNLLGATSELIEYCKEKGILINPTVLKDMRKGPSWLRVVAKLHFSGMNVVGFDADELGLDGFGENCDENRVYLEIIEKLQTFPDVRNKHNYDEFMSWLVGLNFVENKTNTKIIENVPGWVKSMQPELCHLATESDKHSRVGFDPNVMCFKTLRIYKCRHSFMKQQILQVFIEEAPQEFVKGLFKKWLNDGEVCEWLFKQHYYPLNMMHGEYCEWNILLYGLKKILPEAVGDVVTSFRQCIAGNESAEDFPEEEVSLFLGDNVFGRTLLAKGVENRYLKFQSKTEGDLEFGRGYERLKLVRKRKRDLCLESFVPNPKRLMRINNPYALLKYTNASMQAKEVFKRKVENKPCFAFEFTTPSEIPYEEYIYDVKNDSEAMEGLHKYVKDYGRLWKFGLLPPPCLSAFHDIDEKRKHITLTPFINSRCEGAIEQWNGQATDFPNVGGAKMGMRDKVDIMLPEEKSKEYINRQTISTESLEGKNKIRMEELSKAAQGICLQYARRFNHQFNHKSQASIEKIKRDVGDLLIDLFSHALPLSADECRTLMEEHDLLNQVSREISYWLSKDACYVSDLRKAEINRHVYPHLPSSMQGCVLTDEQNAYLKEYGFVDTSKSYDGTSCQLGAQSGRMPLVALNALVVKILAYGILEIAEMEQQAMTEAAKTISRESYVA